MPPPTPPRLITSDAEQSPVAAPPVGAPVPPKAEVKETPKPPRRVAVAFTPKGNADGSGSGQNGTSNAPTGNNNGDRPGTVGDQGSPEGTLNGDALYGNAGQGGPGAGGSGGGSLDMPGWAFDEVPGIPKIDDTNGLARFRIKINADGEVESVTKISSNLSPAQEKAVRDALLNASFRHTTGDSDAATGFYNFRYSVR